MKRLIIAALMAALTGCSVQPLVKTRMFAGIAEPRTEYDLRLTIVKNTETDWACRKLYWEKKASPPPIFLTTIHACMWTEVDREVSVDRLPICWVILPEGIGPGDTLYDHEMGHCEGWDDAPGTVFPEWEKS